MAQHYESLSSGAEKGDDKRWKAGDFAPSRTFSSLVLQVLLKWNSS